MKPLAEDQVANWWQSWDERPGPQQFHSASGWEPSETTGTVLPASCSVPTTDPNWW